MDWNKSIYDSSGLKVKCNVVLQEQNCIRNKFIYKYLVKILGQVHGNQKFDLSICTRMKLLNQ